MSDYDLVIKGGNVVIPYLGVRKADIGIVGEKVGAIADSILPEEAGQVIAYKDDAISETTSAASGGVTTILSYFRTGHSYLNKMGPYKEIFPELLDLSKDSFLVDYGYHLALFTDEQIGEIEWLVREAGVSTFKYFMFYKLLNLAGSSPDALNYLMIDTPIDLGFLYKYMKEHPL